MNGSGSPGFPDEALELATGALSVTDPKQYQQRILSFRVNSLYISVERNFLNWVGGDPLRYRIDFALMLLCCSLEATVMGGWELWSTLGYSQYLCYIFL